MADVTRAPVFTAAEAEAQLRAKNLAPAAGVQVKPSEFAAQTAPEPGAYKPAAETETEPLTEKQKAFVAAVEKFTPKLHGLSETEADIVLPDRRVIHLVKPKNATQVRQFQILAQLLPEGNYPEELKNMVHMLMYVKAVDNDSVTQPFNKVEAQDILNKIGDEYVTHCVNGWYQHFIMKGVTLPL